MFFALYLRRLSPTLSLRGDSAELVTAAAVWGVPHPPGYPLFTSIAHVFTWLPLETLPWRVHLTSAVFHAATVGVTVLATFALTRHRVASLAAGILLGLERSFLLGSLYAEVFPLNDLFFAWLLLLGLRVREGRIRALPFAFGCGVAAAHHMMIALAAPAMGILVLPALRARRSWREWGLLSCAFLIPVLLAYSLVPLAAARDPALSWGDVHDASSFVRLVARSDYGGVFSAVHGAGHGTGWARMVAWGQLVATGFGSVAILLAAVGLVFELRRRRASGIAFLAAVVTTGPFFSWLNAVAIETPSGLAFFERFTTMSAVPLAILAGAGVASVAEHARGAPWARRAAAVALGALLTLCFFQARDVDLHQDRRGVAFAHDLVTSTPDNSLLLLTGDAPTNAALYVCAVERACGTRVALAPGTLFMPWAMAQARRRHGDVAIPWESGPALRRTHEIAVLAASTRPVFVYPDLLEKDSMLERTLLPLPAHLLFRLWPRDADAVEEQAAFEASARSLVTGKGCEGCSLSNESETVADEAGIVAAYEAAAFNHARVAATFPETRDLVSPLLARSGPYAQRGGESMSRNSSSSSR